MCCVECGEQPSLCIHVEQFYSKITGTPIVVWYLDKSIIDEEITLEEEPSDTGDICHRNIKGLSKGAARRFAKNHCKPENLSVCIEQEARSFDPELLTSVSA